MSDVLVELLNRAEVLPDGVLTGCDARAWPTAEVERLVSMGILVDDGCAEVIEYDDCDHQCAIENTGFIEHPKKPGRTVCVHPCMNGCGLVLLEPADFAQWRFSLLGLATVVARAIGASGSVIVDVPDRVVLVGTVQYQMETRDVFLALGLGRADASGVVVSSQRLHESKAPFVLSVGVMPSSGIWPDGMAPAAVVLAEYATLSPFGLALDIEQLLGLESVPHPDADPSVWLTVTQAAEKLMTVVDNLDLKRARARVSGAANNGKFTTNGEKRAARKIDLDSFSTWLFEQQEINLAKSEW